MSSKEERSEDQNPAPTADPKPIPDESELSSDDGMNLQKEKIPPVGKLNTCLLLPMMESSGILEDFTQGIAMDLQPTASETATITGLS